MPSIKETNHKEQHATLELDPYFQARLICPLDFKEAQTEARKIAGNKPPSKHHIQQAILTLNLKTREEYNQIVALARDHAKLHLQFNQVGIDHLLNTARSQTDIRSILRIERVNYRAMGNFLKSITPQSIDFLISNFPPEEITALVSDCGLHFESLLDAFTAGKVDVAHVQRIRSLFTPEQRLLLFKNFSQVITHFEQANLDTFLSLSTPEINSLLKNSYIKYFWEEMGPNTRQVLRYIRNYTKTEQLYLHVLENLSEFGLFSQTPEQVLARLEILNKLFMGNIPWKKIYPPDQSIHKTPRQTGLSSLSPKHIREIQRKFGDKIAQQLLINPNTPLNQHTKSQRFTTGLSQFAKLLGKETIHKLLNHKGFISLAETIYIKTPKDYYPATDISWKTVQSAYQAYGHDQFITLCQASGCVDDFVRNWALITSALSPKTLSHLCALLTESKCDPILGIGVGLLCSGSTQDKARELKKLDQLPPDKQDALLLNYASDFVKEDELYDWINQTPVPFLSASIYYLNHPAFGGANRVLPRFRLLIKLFGETQATGMLKKATIAQTILELPDSTLDLWETSSCNPSPADLEFIVQGNLVSQFLKTPQEALSLGQNTTSRLSILFNHEPLIAKQAGPINTRLGILAARGFDTDQILRKMAHRLSDPALTDTSKLWYLYGQIMGAENILKPSDPILNDLPFLERAKYLRQRLEEIVLLSHDPHSIETACARNLQFEKLYNSSKRITIPILLHGKSSSFPDDISLGYRCAELLGPDQYQWGDTPNALNLMLMHPNHKTFIDAYLHQGDPIAANFGSSPDKSNGITHIFTLEDTSHSFNRYPVKLYPCQSHGKQHKLILFGLPTTAELCAVVNSTDQTVFQSACNYFARLPFPCPLIDVNTGNIVFASSDYYETRKHLLNNGELVDLSNSSSVDALLTRIYMHYRQHTSDHGLTHIQNALSHLEYVCKEIYQQNKSWFAQNHLEYSQFTNATRIAIAAHDINRMTDENDAHAITGAKTLASILNHGLHYPHQTLIQTAIKQHNLPTEKRWSNDPITQALYDIDKADTQFERGADPSYIRMVLPTVSTHHTRSILTSLLTR